MLAGIGMALIFKQQHHSIALDLKLFGLRVVPGLFGLPYPRVWI
jgi:hypothetical protein